MDNNDQARITVGTGHALHNRRPSVSHLPPKYTENKYVKRVTIFFFVYSNQVKYSSACQVIR